MERDRAELERRLALAVEELWCDDKDFRKVLDLFKEVVSCIEVGRRLRVGRILRNVCLNRGSIVMCPSMLIYPHLPLSFTGANPSMK